MFYQLIWLCPRCCISCAAVLSCQSMTTLCCSYVRVIFCAAAFPTCKAVTHFVSLLSLPANLQHTLCCCFPCLQSCNALYIAVFPACKVARRFVLLLCLPANLQCSFCCCSPCPQSCNAEQSAGTRCILHLSTHKTNVSQLLQAMQLCGG